MQSASSLSVAPLDPVWDRGELLARMRENLTLVREVAILSPVDSLSGGKVFAKREDLQPTHSFKLRGAYCAIARLSASERAKGVIAASAGNHAQGVGLAARRLGIDAEIVVPTTTPEVKQNAIRSHGATLILHGDSYDDAFAFASARAAKTGRVFVHPYDDPDVIAGQGTIGLELAEQLPAGCRRVYVAIGGGGLLSGVALALAELRPEIEVVGVEPEDSDAMTLSLERGVLVRKDKVGLFADGVAVKQVGRLTFSILNSLGIRTIRVSNDEICAAVKEFYDERRAILEPAGALAFAGLKSEALGEGMAAFVACGANMSFDRLGFVAERAALGEHSEAIFAVEIPERPGAFRRLCDAMENRNITEFNYRMSDADRAIVFVGVRTKLASDSGLILSQLLAEGFGARDLSQNELAKTHVRHMVGGKSRIATDERLFHFDFPERPGALGEFLRHLAGQWNISLFHYRNHGADKGRVLVGIQVPERTSAKFSEFLVGLGYEYTEVTDDDSVRLFL